MSVYDEVQEALKLDVRSASGTDGLTFLDISKFPPGWQDIARIYWGAVTSLEGIVTRMYIKNGILKADAHAVDIYQNEAIKWLTQQMAKVSSLRCMLVPGKRAYRRKEHVGWPCISGDLFITYVNELAERESHEAESKEVV
jgi:hypothetical protein